MVCIGFASGPQWLALGPRGILGITRLVSGLGWGSKAHILQENGFALGTQCEGTGNKRHEMYMPNANPTLTYLKQTILHWLGLGLMLCVIGSQVALLACLGHYLLVLGDALGPMRVISLCS